MLTDEGVLRVANESEPALLQLAAINGRVVMAEELLTRGVARVDAVCRAKRQTAAHIAASGNTVSFWSCSADDSRHVSDRLGHTPLMVAAANDEVGPVELPKGGCLPEPAGHTGHQALHRLL